MIVDVAQVEKELARIQRELTSSEVKASLFNLVVFSPDLQAAMADDALNYLLGKRAARVIHVADSDDNESSLDVSARCFVDADRKSVCFQEIIIANGRDRAGGAPGSWVPLLVRDLPTFVLWMDTVTDNRDLLLHAREQADKLLVDTEKSVALGDDEEDVFRIVQEIAFEDGIPVSDFAFSRLRPVQKIVAMAFDDPARTPLLERVTAVRVKGGTSISSRLLLLWLAERLGWTPDQGTAPGESFRDRRGNAVTFRHEPDERALPGEVQIGFSEGDPVAVHLLTDGCADVDCPDGAELHPFVGARSPGEILLEEVDKVTGDRLYRQALAARS